MAQNKNRRQGRTPRTDVAAAAADASGTLGGGVLDGMDASAPRGSARIRGGDEVPATPREMLPEEERREGWSKKWMPVVGVIGTLVTVGGAIWVFGKGWGELTKSVQTVQEDVRDIKAKTQQLVVDTAKSGTRLELLEQRIIAVPPPRESEQRSSAKRK